MRITESKLRQIIKEEIQDLLEKSYDDDFRQLGCEGYNKFKETDPEKYKQCKTLDDKRYAHEEGGQYGQF